MKLTKIEAHGFKSFADPITLKFDGGVTGIIGPNGSGKSNINDAIKWVLGEQSSKELRGDNMSDVIFAGSKTAQQMNRAQVSLTFDNTVGNSSSFPSEEITITRVLERGKGSEYYINGELSRQKNIKSLAMETGIGKSSLAIISQGTVANIAESTDEQRRAIFEEAAGVSKYKFRKLEALRKLDKTTEALDKVQTIVNELEKQMIPLQKQAEKAKEYISKSEQLKDVEIALLAHEINYYGNEFSRLSKELEGVAETQQDYNAKIDDFTSKIIKNTLHRDELQKEISVLLGKSKAIADRLKDLEIIANKEAHRQELIASGEIQASTTEQVKIIKELLEQLKHKINYFIGEEEKLKKSIATKEAEIENLNNKVNQETIILNDRQTKKIKLEAKLQLLLEQKESRSNLFRGTKVILDNKAGFKGLQGIVADIIKVKPEYIVAIETILANATQHIVVDNSDVAVKAVNFLKSNKAGRATFIPLNSIRPKEIRDDHMLVIQSHQGFVGIASNLVESNQKYEVLKQFLLGNIIVVETIEDANKLGRVLSNRYMIVTLDGDVIRVGGVIVGGTNERSQNFFGIDEQIKEIQNLLPGVNSLLKSCDDKIYDLKVERGNIYQIASEWQKDLTSLVEKRVFDQNKFAELNIKIQSITKEEINISEKASTMIENVEILQSEFRSISSQLRAKDQILNSLNSEINHSQLAKTDLEKTLRDLNNSFNKKISAHERAKIYFNQFKERLTVHYKLTVETAQENYKLSIPLEEAREFVDTTKDEIKALGNVNLESIAQLEEVESRFNNFVSNRDELLQAKQTVLSAIAEMDKIIITRITNIVEDVDKEIDLVFKTMFGGGMAHIAFVDPENILESGIKIEAQPPGKSVKNLKLFSGGEKSIIAISLLFGILKARPLPLCILDEVEAALDEANVVRFAEYLQTLKSKTQFVVITHRHGSMSRMDSLFGATMQKRGITSFFSIELKQAKEYVEKYQKEEQLST